MPVSSDLGLIELMAAAVLVALLVDRLCGEPPTWAHPVAWMGSALGWMGQRLAPHHDPAAPLNQERSDWSRFFLGAVAWVLGATVVSLLAWHVQWVSKEWNIAFAAVWLGLWLKPMMAWRMLWSEVRAVESALGESLEAGRARLAWLVSRDVAQLSAEQVRESAIESLAENLNDSVVAPLFWFVVAGLPGAALYRFANTADAMWGYIGVRQGRDWTWAGKWAARADDMLSWVPARMTAGLLMVAGTSSSWRGLASQASRTPSPNSGWPMAAMAVVLGVRLGKPGVYALNEGAPQPEAGHTHMALRTAGRVVSMLAVLGVLLWVWAATDQALLGTQP